jgi:hypothetical protein
LKRLTAGIFVFAGDHLAGGKPLPPAHCKPPGVTQITAGTSANSPGVLFTAGTFQFARGIELPPAKQPYVPAVCILGFKKKDVLPVCSMRCQQCKMYCVIILRQWNQLSSGQGTKGSKKYTGHEECQIKISVFRSTSRAQVFVD